MTHSVTINFSGNSVIAPTDSTATPGTAAVPAVLEYKNYVYAIYAASDPNNPSIWQLAYDGTSWQGNQRIGWGASANANYPMTSCAPGLAALKNTLYLAWIDQSSASDSEGTIYIASASVSATSRSPIAPTDWQPLTGTYVNGMPGPVAGSQGLAMIAFPYNGVDSLWVFYNNGKGNLCVAIAQPAATTTGVNWVYANTIQSWTENANPNAPMNPKLSGLPAAAVINSVPYVVFIGSSGSYLNSIYLDPSTNNWGGNQHISVDKGNPLDLKAGSTPNLLAFSPPGKGSLNFAMLFYQGLHGTSVDLSAYVAGRWYGNISIDFLSGLLGPGINPTTKIGIGSAMSGLTQMVMVYPSASSSSDQDLWASYATITVT